MSHQYRFQPGDRVTILSGRYKGHTSVVDSAVFQRPVTGFCATGGVDRRAIRRLSEHHSRPYTLPELAEAIESADFAT